MRMNANSFPSEYIYMSDTLCVGRIIKPIGNTDYKPIIAKWNMKTGKISEMAYENKKIDKKRITFTASKEHSMYVECYNNYDLMTICDLDGNLRYNIYGPDWTDTPNKNEYFTHVLFCKNKIVASFAGDNESSDLPTELIIFSTHGDYIKTVNVGYPISDFCFDKENDRIIMSLDDEMQLAYLDFSLIEK